MNSIEQSGTTLAMNENSKKLDKLTNAVYIIGGGLILTIVLLVAFGIFMADHYNIVDYVAYKFKGGC